MGKAADALACPFCVHFNYSGTKNSLYLMYVRHLQQWSYCKYLASIPSNVHQFPQWFIDIDKTNPKPILNNGMQIDDENNPSASRGPKRFHNDAARFYGDRKHRIVHDPNAWGGQRLEITDAQMTNPYLCINCVE